jgi:hypothetical protein
MIISGGSRANWRYFARHLTNAKDNDRVEVIELRGLAADSVFEAFREMDEIARWTRCGNFFYHGDINPREGDSMTREQAVIAADRLQKNLGLEGQPRIMVEHVKEGRQHWHIAVLRIDMDTLTAISDSHNYKIHAQTSRELEREFGHAPVRDILIGEDQRPERRPKNWEKLRGGKSGLDPENIKAEVTELWHEADSGKAFAAALADAGYVLCRGDKRDFCVIDPAGHEHSLARRIEGMKAAELRAFMADIDRDALPTVAEGRERQRKEPETRKERVEEKRYEHFVAPVHQAMRETGEVPLYGMEPTWWERAAGVIGRMTEKAVEIAGKAVEVAKDYWRGLVGGRDDVGRERDDGLDR